MKPTKWAYEQAAEQINAEPAAVEAIFEVEAAGQFFDSAGNVLRRFEPHHFPKQHWPVLGFTVKKGQAPWRASLALSRKARAAMYERAKAINAELAYRASSWGAPQIMGFNYKDAGFQSAAQMVEAFYDPALQVAAFVTLIDSWGLGSAVRSHDWHTFASRYNGPGKARDYAGKIERAYRRASGSSTGSAIILRIGSSGAAVAELQGLLNMAGASITTDGSFGPATRDAVIDYQHDAGLKPDGVVGAMTWQSLRKVARPAEVVVPTQRTDLDELLDKAKGWGGAIAATGAGSQLLTVFNDNAPWIIGGVVVLAVLFVGYRHYTGRAVI